MCSLGKTIGLSKTHKQSSKLTIPLTVWLVIYLIHLPAQAKYGGGTGTENNPYLIYTPEQMNDIGATPGDWNMHFKLTADIDMSGYPGTAYNIIGTAPFESFSGVFDGNDQKIINLSLTSTRERYTGLFGYVTGQIKNLGLIGPDIFAQGSNVGSLAGNLETGTITDCYAKSAHVSGNNNIGGLIGSSTGRIDNCFSSGNISGDWYVGGLIGLILDSTVNTSYSQANVAGNRDVGGLAGKTADEGSVVSNCYATGRVSGGIYAGGLVGQVERGRTYKCYSTGRVSGNEYVGGFTGFIRVLGSATHCFWDTQTSSQSTSAGGTGKTTAEMKTISTFTNAAWNFWNTWTICEGTNYPVLQWQIPVADFSCPDGVDFIDFAFFAAHWHLQGCNASNNYCEGTDLDHSGSVGFIDLEILAKRWLEGTP